MPGAAKTLAGVVAALTGARIFETLAPFDPHHIGTWPLGLALDGSDVDIAVHAPDPAAFRSAAERAFGSCRDFTVTPHDAAPPALVLRFMLGELPIEIFASPEPVRAQAGWRHMIVEARLLALATAAFRTEILAAKAGGLKTEPAFARLLGLDGDPYQAMLMLEPKGDEALAALLASRGYLRPQPIASAPHTSLKRPYTTKGPRRASTRTY